MGTEALRKLTGSFCQFAIYSSWCPDLLFFVCLFVCLFVFFQVLVKVPRVW